MRKKIQMVLSIVYLLVMFSLVVNLLEQPFKIFHQFAWVLLCFYIGDIVDVFYHENRFVQSLCTTGAFMMLFKVWTMLYTMLKIPPLLSHIFWILAFVRLVLCFIPWKQWKVKRYRGFHLLRDLPLLGMLIVLEILYIQSGNTNGYGLWIIKIILPFVYTFFCLEDLNENKPAIWVGLGWLSHLSLALVFMQMIGQI